MYKLQTLSPSTLFINIVKLRERQWNQTVAKLSFLPQDNHYYDTFPIKPKYYFMEALAKTRLPLYHLQIPIPLTFISLNTHSTLIYYGFFIMLFIIL